MKYKQEKATKLELDFLRSVFIAEGNISNIEIEQILNTKDSNSSLIEVIVMILQAQEQNFYSPIVKNRIEHILHSFSQEEIKSFFNPQDFTISSLKKKKFEKLKEKIAESISLCVKSQLSKGFQEISISELIKDSNQVKKEKEEKEAELLKEKEKEKEEAKAKEAKEVELLKKEAIKNQEEALEILKELNVSKWESVEELDNTDNITNIEIEVLNRVFGNNIFVKTPLWNQGSLFSKVQGALIFLRSHKEDKDSSQSINIIKGILPNLSDKEFEFLFTKYKNPILIAQQDKLVNYVAKDISLQVSSLAKEQSHNIVITEINKILSEMMQMESLSNDQADKEVKKIMLVLEERVLEADKTDIGKLTLRVITEKEKEQIKKEFKGIISERVLNWVFIEEPTTLGGFVRKMLILENKFSEEYLASNPGEEKNLLQTLIKAILKYKVALFNTIKTIFQDKDTLKVDSNLEKVSSQSVEILTNLFIEEIRDKAANMEEELKRKEHGQNFDRPITDLEIEYLSEKFSVFKAFKIILENNKNKKQSLKEVATYIYNFSTAEVNASTVEKVLGSEIQEMFADKLQSGAEEKIDEMCSFIERESKAQDQSVMVEGLDKKRNSFKSYTDKAIQERLNITNNIHIR